MGVVTLLDDMSMIRHALRGRRTLRDGTKLEKSSNRRKAYSAGMQQFEEQLDAARVVTPLTRPINLYYGLVQAGLAIRAAYADDPWSFDKHGLKSASLEPELPDIQIIPSGQGAFQAVSSTTGSRDLSAPVSIGALWASLPDLCDAATMRASDPPALFFAPSLFNYTSSGQAFPGPRASIYVNPRIFETGQTSAQSLLMLQQYPGLAGATVVGGPDPGKKIMIGVLRSVWSGLIQILQWNWTSNILRAFSTSVHLTIDTL